VGARVSKGGEYMTPEGLKKLLFLTENDLFTIEIPILAAATVYWEVVDAIDKTFPCIN
jgi:hypothetical protein